MANTSGVVHEPKAGCCGPASLSACLAILGLDAEPAELASVAGGDWDACARGLDPDRPNPIASRLGVRGEFLVRDSRDEAPEFTQRLREHLQRGTPALVLVSNFGRWVAVAGWLEDGSYVVLDPRDGGQAFSRWAEQKLVAEAWNEDEAGEEPSSHFAILVRRRDGEPAKWRLTREFLDLCETISEDGAIGMVCDLEEMIRRADPREDFVGHVRLSEVLETLEAAVLDSIEHWERGPEVAGDQLRRRFRDYRVVADAAGLQVPMWFDRTVLAVQLTSLLSAYVRTGTCER